MMADLRTVAESLVRTAGLGSVRAVEPLAGGRNNRTGRVEAGTGVFVCKQYFSAGTHDRFRSETAWLTFCAEQQIGCVPRLVAVDPIARAALLEWIPGRRVTATEITEVHVTAAAEFIRQLTAARDAVGAAALPHAAEACFSLTEHVACIERRIERLAGITITDDLDQQLHTFLVETLQPLWKPIAASLRCTPQASISLPSAERSLSPSDFGFHNALISDPQPSTLNPQLTFLDFEYAGWDDPAKLVCDFYWQVEIPAPRRTMNLLVDALPTTNRADLVHRVRQLFPAYGVKWCTIVLNEFLHHDRQRRAFAAAGEADQRARQLALAQRLADDVARNPVLV